MATAIETSTDLYGSHPPQAVYVRDNWGDAWGQPVQYLYCDRMTLTAAPTLPTAQLVYRYGEALQPGATSWAAYSRQDLGGKYVRVQVAGLGDWFGVILDRDDDRWGAKIAADDTRTSRGVEHYTAVGLEDLLDRVTIRESIVSDGSGGEKTIARAIPFNGGSDNPVRKPADGANAHKNKGEKDTWIFTDTFWGEDPRTWNARRIIEYLLAYFPPKDESDNQDLPIELDTDEEVAQVSALEWHEPTLVAEGRTLKGILERLVDRRRGLGWKLVIDEGANKILVRVFSHAAADITLSGGTLPGNLDQRTLDFDTAVNMEAATVRTSRAHRYDQIVVRGARRGSICTISFTDETLSEDWTQGSGSSEELYEKAASVESDYSDLTDVEKRRRNKEVRSQDDLQRVFSWFKLPFDWDGKVGDGEGGTKNPAIPKLDSNGDATSESIPLWVPGIRFEPDTPLLTDHSYETTPVGENVPENSNVNVVPPIVLIKTHPETDRYVHVEDATQEEDSAGDGGRDWSCDVRVDDRAPRLILPVIGETQHHLARDNFTALSADEFSTDEALSYTDLVCTVYFLGDESVVEKNPADDSVSATDVKRALELHVADAHLDWMPDQTVYRVEHGALKRSTGGRFIRDDRDRLKDIAETAWEWYGTDRSILELSYKSLEGVFQPGILITKIGKNETEETINTVITSVDYDLIAGTTSLRTDFAEIDPEVFL